MTSAGIDSEIVSVCFVKGESPVLQLIKGERQKRGGKQGASQFIFLSRYTRRVLENFVQV